MYGICGVPGLGENRLSKILISNPSPAPLPPSKKRSGCESQKSRFGFEPKNPPRVWILWIHDPFFGFAPKNTKFIFGFGNPDLDFPPKTHPQTPYFLPALTAALTFKFKLLALHKRGKYERQHILGLKIYQTDDQFKTDMTGVSCHLLVPW